MQKRWWDLYRQGLAIFKGDKGAAARRAWSYLKREGARTLFDKYSNRSAKILYDTGRLFNSITVGHGWSGATIRSNHPAANAHHNGVPGRLPQRRLWPGPNRWPAEWWKDIINEVAQGVVDITVQTLKTVK